MRFSCTVGQVQEYPRHRRVLDISTSNILLVNAMQREPTQFAIYAPGGLLIRITGQERSKHTGT
jgi:hypothetical protein